jgi:hypothetical protein
MTLAVLPESRSFRFEAKGEDPGGPDAGGPAGPSLELTASDGTGLLLVSLSARVVVDDPLAFTELHLVFENPERRQLEGRFRIALPSGATVSRFAMRVGGQWQEGEVVERQAARRAYEDFLHRRQDPALLEHEAGNEFSARVFPIEAGERKELIVSYGQELVRQGDLYRLPLLGLPRLGSLEIRALVGRAAAEAAEVEGASSLGGTSSSTRVVEVRKTDWKPDADFEVRPTPPPDGRAGLRHGNLAVVRVSPELPEVPDEVGSLLVLIDTSASRALGLARQAQVVLGLIDGLARGASPEVPLAIAFFDQEVELAFEGTAGGFAPADGARLLAQSALGASDLTGALRWAAAWQGPEGRRYERVVVVTDGISTAGALEPERIVEAARALGGAGAQRLDAIAVGGLRDDGALRRLVTAGLTRDGTVCDGDLSPPEIAARLTRATRSGISVEIPGALWVWPARLDGMQPGEAALIYADLPADEGVRVLLDGKPVRGGYLALADAERPLLERAWVKARIEKLEALRASGRDPDVNEGLRRQVIELSTAHRVLSPHTALLVLESDEDYARFQIDRRALADILTVGISDLEMLHRSGAPAPAPKEPRRPRPARAEQHVARKKRAARPHAAEGDGADGDWPELEAERGPSAPAADSFEDDSADEVMMSRERADTGAPAAMAEVEPSPEDSFSESTLAGGGEPMRDIQTSPALVTRTGVAAPSAAMPMPMSMPMPSPRAAMSAPMARPASPPAPSAPSPLRRLVDAVTSVFAGRDEAAPATRPPPSMAGAPPHEPPRPPPAPQPPAPQPPPPPTQDERIAAWTGQFREAMVLLLSGNAQGALELALAWRDAAPGDVLALIALGEAAEALGDGLLAARAYGAIIDLFPSRADLRRFAGERLSRLADAASQALAIDTYTKAVESRPDHPSGHRLLAMALLRAGRCEEAFEAIASGQARSYPPKFPGVARILTEDMGLVAAAWIRAEPSRRDEIMGRLRQAGAHLEQDPSVRFVLVWETDANDVDFHIHDARGGHAYFRDKVLPSGGELYADVTQGYGPECFTIRGAPGGRAYPYRLQAHYYRRGPMGYGMGSLQIIEHDGQGGFVFEERPYVVMQDMAYLDLGVVEGPLPSGK